MGYLNFVALVDGGGLNCNKIGHLLLCVLFFVVIVIVVMDVLMLITFIY